MRCLFVHDFGGIHVVIHFYTYTITTVCHAVACQTVVKLRSMHMWDGLICFGLCSLAWFSFFLSVLKAVSKFVTDEKRALMAAFAQAGLHGTVALFKSVRVPPFAKWRWGTIWENCRSLIYVLPQLIAHYGIIAAHLACMTDGAHVGKVKVALTCPAWYREFKFVCWFSEKLCKTMSWGSSCKCHEEDYANNVAVECDEKGRLLPWAYHKAVSTLEELHSDAMSWTVGTWGGSREFLINLQGMCGSVYSRGMQKHAFLDEVPYIFARLGFETGINKRAIAQFDSAPRSKHNKVSIQLCDRDTENRRMLVEMDDDLEVPAGLQHRILAIQKGNLLDKIAEGPHAIFKSESDRARGSQFPWVAASVRLKQNLADVRELCEIMDVDVQLVWTRYKTILQEDKHRNRNKRLSMEEFQERVYFCTIPLGSEAEADAQNKDECKKHKQLI